MVAVLNVMLGTGLLVGGRKLFWLLVGALGFLVGLEVAARFTMRSELLFIITSLALGLVFALMAVFLESVAIGVAGFVGGGLALMRLVALLSGTGSVPRLFTFILGGVIGVILVVWLFNWGLIVISAVAGASMIVAGIPMRTADRPFVSIALVLIGLAIQGVALQREGRTPRPGAAPPL